MTMLLTALGCLPFLFGWLMNWYMMQHMDKTPPFFLISVLFLILWFGIAFFAQTRMESTGKTVCRLNLVPFVVLFLAAVQRGIVGSYWFGLVGVWTQYFYLPLVWLGFRLTAWSSSSFMAFVGSFGLMIAVSVLACKCRKK